ncbi:hypothetical protein [Agrobacterium tumefaciens]|uniref:hypothetical protein n=1 Tax=Agrobacterium tumefaciens TaxID=358 RepID=UPI0021CEA31D|nr:hypothetical protein [Agrobacterium tumefaciens]UXS05536.1 hypothetical protein FY156_28815 [Agrobacterium tumefaciens]
MGGAVAMCDPLDLEQNRLQRNRTLTEFVHISCSLPPVVFVAGAIVTIAANPQIVRNHRNPNQVSQQSIWRNVLIACGNALGVACVIDLHLVAMLVSGRTNFALNGLIVMQMLCRPRRKKALAGGG